jgi:osmoprotectant transport system permease protein
MGMSQSQLFWRVELPLALPLILEGIRGAVVLALGITTVAALIGAGGLGYFILRGVDSGAPDMVLLGALPVIGLALLLDSGLRWLGLGLRKRLGM